MRRGLIALLPTGLLAVLLGSTGPAFGQEKSDKEKEPKVSNDDPSRPFQLPPATPEVKEALDDFDRFGRRGAWERALKSLYSIPEPQVVRFIDGENGFVIPVASKRRALLSALPVEGMAAYRTFHDADAKKLFEEADGPNQLKDLERVYSAYFSTSVGDNAADRLGDLYFELGRFDRAADCWLTILRERPDTDLSPALVSLKAALALHRAGRRGEFDQVRADLKDRHDDETVTLGGESGKPTEVLRKLIGDDSTGSAPSTKPAAAEAGPELAGLVEPAWQVRFAESVEAGMTPLEQTQWDSNSLSVAVPSIADGGSSLFVNYLGYGFALDSKTGKMTWRSSSFHMLDVMAMQQQAAMVDPARFAVVASGDLVWFVSRDLKDQNMFSPFRLSCRRTAGGDVVWKSDDLADYAAFDLQGAPLLVDDRLYIIAKGSANQQQQPQENLPKQWVLAIRPGDGKILWKAEVGTFRQAQQMYFYYYAKDTSPQPRLILQSGSIYVDTNAGVLARLDADSGSLEWGYGYKTDAVQGQNMMFFFYNMPPPEATTASAPPIRLDDTLIVKGAQSDQIQAVDPNRMKVLWERPISKSSRVLGTDGRVVFFGGPEISAMDLKTKELLWATRIPGGSLESRVLVRPEGIWQLTPRGIFEIDPKSGAVRRIFRGGDLGAFGGDLYLTDRWLISASNRTISAYPRRGGRAEAPAPGGPGTTNQRASHE